jgi:hypothetical protein
VTPAVRADAPSGADKAGRRAFPPHPLRILGRKFLRNADTAPPLHAADETGSEHGASPPRRVCRRARLACQEPFVWVASAMETVPDGASELVCRMGSAGWALVTGAVG